VSSSELMPSLVGCSPPFPPRRLIDLLMRNRSLDSSGLPPAIDVSHPHPRTLIVVLDFFPSSLLQKEIHGLPLQSSGSPKEFTKTVDLFSPLPVVLSLSTVSLSPMLGFFCGGDCLFFFSSPHDDHDGGASTLWSPVLCPLSGGAVF